MTKPLDGLATLSPHRRSRDGRCSAPAARPARARKRPRRIPVQGRRITRVTEIRPGRGHVRRLSPSARAEARQGAAPRRGGRESRPARFTPGKTSEAPGPAVVRPKRPRGAAKAWPTPGIRRSKARVNLSKPEQARARRNPIPKAADRHTHRTRSGAPAALPAGAGAEPEDPDGARPPGAPRFRCPSNNIQPPVKGHIDHQRALFRSRAGLNSEGTLPQRRLT